MPPSPMKQKRAKVRERALELAERGLNRRGGPVDKGSPEAQKQAAKPMQGEKPIARNRAALGALSLHRNNTGNERSGQLFRTIAKKGGEVHKYADGRSVFVRKDTGGTGNRVHKAEAGSSQQMISDLARRRSTENRPKAKRRLFARTS